MMWTNPVFTHSSRFSAVMRLSQHTWHLSLHLTGDHLKQRFDTAGDLMLSAAALREIFCYFSAFLNFQTRLSLQILSWLSIYMNRFLHNSTWVHPDTSLDILEQERTEEPLAQWRASSRPRCSFAGMAGYRSLTVTAPPVWNHLKTSKQHEEESWQPLR